MIIRTLNCEIVIVDIICGLVCQVLLLIWTRHNVNMDFIMLRGISRLLLIVLHFQILKLKSKLKIRLHRFFILNILTYI
jgi:hypothetical protein